MKRTMCSIASLFIIGIVGPVLGATITVDTVDPGISANGWCSLIEAIDNANADAAVHVDCPAGSGGDLIVLGNQLTYTLDEVHNNNLGPNGLPVISSEITINGRGSTVERDDGATELRLFFIGVTGNLTLNDLTARNGDVGGEDGGAIFNLGSVVLNRSEIRDSSASNCGGILNQAGEAWLNDSDVISNESDLDGGGLCNLAVGGDATMILNRSLVAGNTAGDDAGGIENETSDGQAATLELVDCEISYNTAGETLAGIGGGVLSSSSGGPIGAAASMTIIGSEISHNTASSTGAGGIACHGNLNTGFAPELVIRNSHIFENQSQAGAGVVGHTNARLTIEDSTISDNRAVGFLVGGVLLLSGSDLQLIRSTISGNTSFAPSGGWGGGVGISDSNMTVFNSTISGNEASGPGAQGGGIGTMSSTAWGGYGSQVVIENSTITENEASSLGCGIAAHLDSGSGVVVVELRNTVVADNHDQDGIVLGNCILTAPAFLTSNGFNLADDLTCDLVHGDDLIVADAMLGPLGNNGGPTASHSPLPGSPVIDSGDDTGCPDTDQRGFPRPFDGDDDGVPWCDRGSVEFGLFFMDGFESGDTSAWSSAVP